MKILELFSGYGTASFALKQLGIDYECVGYSDINKYANQCFKQNHSGPELGDATKIDPKYLDNFDLLTAGFPCQAFSVAGKGLGELDTRGTLFNEIIRIAEVKQPRYMMLENVKGLLSPRHKQTFEKILSELKRIGYNIHWKVLNTADYGIPQNRERVFIICFRNHDEWFNFQFPEKEDLKIFLKDILEYGEADRNTSYCIDANYNKGTSYEDYKKKCRRQIVVHRVVGNVKVRKHLVDTDSLKKVLRDNKKYSCKEISEKLGIKKTTVEHWFRTDCCFSIPEEDVWLKLKELLDIKTDEFDKPIMEFEIRDNKFDMANRVYSPYGISPTLTTITGGKQLKIIDDEYGYRLMTPKECFRLQGFLNDEVNLEGISNSQQYKLAGNGQSVNVVKKIFENMFATSFLKTTEDKDE
jgi:DNA (cytosine-5)-methyltransferase 1